MKVHTVSDVWSRSYFKVKGQISLITFLGIFYYCYIVFRIYLACIHISWLRKLFYQGQVLSSKSQTKLSKKKVELFFKSSILAGDTWVTRNTLVQFKKAVTPSQDVISKGRNSFILMKELQPFGIKPTIWQFVMKHCYAGTFAMKNLVFVVLPRFLFIFVYTFVMELS